MTKTDMKSFVKSVASDLKRLTDDSKEKVNLFIAKVGDISPDDSQIINLFSGDHDFIKAIFHSLMAISFKNESLNIKDLALLFRELIVEMLSDPESRKVLTQTMRLLEDDPVMMALLIQGDKFSMPCFMQDQIQ